MTTAHNIDLPTVLAERLTTAQPDVLRELLARSIHTLMGAEAEALCGAGYGERSSERTNSRKGIDNANSTPVQDRWTWLSPSCVPGLTFRTGCWNGVCRRRLFDAMSFVILPARTLRQQSPTKTGPLQGTHLRSPLDVARRSSRRCSNVDS